MLGLLESRKRFFDNGFHAQTGYMYMPTMRRQ
jgi:hypothetical protein